MFCRNKLLFDLLFDDDEEESIGIFLEVASALKRKPTHEMIKNRDAEGTYNLLIEKYLFSSEDLFVKYLRVTPAVFYDILDHIRDDITTKPSNRVANPISAEHKLSLVLRYLQENYFLRNEYCRVINKNKILFPKFKIHGNR